jgi:hypothetical protein
VKSSLRRKQNYELHSSYLSLVFTCMHLHDLA